MTTPPSFALDRRAFLAAAPTLGLAPRAYAQDDPRTLLWRDGRFLPRLNQLKTEAAAGGGGYPLAYALAWIGDERGAFAHAPVMPRLCPPLKGAHTDDALDAIVRHATGRRIVFLNEAHFASRNRVFALALALRLRKVGFNWLAVENISPNSRKLSAASGGFTPEFLPDDGFSRPDAPITTRSIDNCDPCYAELLRGARRAGYKVFSYEAPGAQFTSANRDTVEAQYLEALLTSDPAARVLVYCGFHHVSKTVTDGKTWVAGRLRDRMKLDPLCIDQAWGTPPPPGAEQDPELTKVIEHFQPTRPTSVTLADGSPLLLNPQLVGGVDISVLHPSLPNVAGRSGWLAEAPGRSKARVPLWRGIPAGSLIQAVPANELARSPAAMPADQYPVTNDAAEAVFFLPTPGRYQVRVETTDGFKAVGEVGSERAP